MQARASCFSCTFRQGPRETILQDNRTTRTEDASHFLEQFLKAGNNAQYITKHHQIRNVRPNSRNLVEHCCTELVFRARCRLR